MQVPGDMWSERWLAVADQPTDLAGVVSLDEVAGELRTTSLATGATARWSRWQLLPPPREAMTSGHPILEIARLHPEGASDVILRLIGIGVAWLTPSDWDAVRACLREADVVYRRVPIGSMRLARVERVDIRANGVRLALRDIQSEQSAIIPLTPAGIAAIRWDGRALETRDTYGWGLRVEVRRCRVCENPLPRPGNDIPLERAFLDRCLTCDATLQREERRQAQLRVGICRGCAHYARNYGARSLGFAGTAHSECTSPERVPLYGSQVAYVTDCPFRRDRANGEERPKTGTAGRLRTEDRRSEHRDPGTDPAPGGRRKS